MLEYLIARFQKEYGLTPVTGNPHAKIDKSGMHFTIHTYRVGEIGSLALLDMKAMLGLMRMETAVFTSDRKDVPLFSMDTIHAAGKHTMLAECYDTMVEPFGDVPEQLMRIAAKPYQALPDYASGPHWYDSIRYDFSLAKTGREVGEQEDSITRSYTDAFLEVLRKAPETDPLLKKAKTRAYVDELFAQGGPAADQISKLLGKDAAKSLFVRYIFCCE